MNKNAQPSIKQLRAIGHKLKPVVTVAGNGLSDAVTSEIDRALNDHELIKIKLAVGDRQNRQAVTEEMCRLSDAKVIQQVGNVVLLLRRTTSPDPKKSNLIRPL